MNFNLDEENLRPKSVDLSTYTLSVGDIVKCLPQYSDDPNNIPYEVVMEVAGKETSNPYVYLTAITPEVLKMKFRPQLKTSVYMIENIIYGNCLEQN
jgi:hypothetical protein